MRPLTVAVSWFITAVAAAQTPTLQDQLSREGPEALAKAARADGDPARGAAVFFQPHLVCARCHAAGEDGPKIGPDLTQLGKEATALYLAESILLPSKVIKKGFETVTVATTSGKKITGLVAEERADALVLRDVSEEAKLITIPKSEIEERTASRVSLMPDGVANQLGSRQEFLDLLRYLIEVAERGPARARELRPANVFAPPPLPEYEKVIDHAGLISSLNLTSFKNGEAIYSRVCANCHGTKDAPGSLPTSLKFHAGQFKNGSDPYRMYRTLTHGYGLMTPQTWMVPQQKYEVIHYIREAFLKPHNPSQFSAVNAAYLKSLPIGTTRGPKPSNVEPWSLMDYGPSMMTTLEVGTAGNFAYKGIAVRLDAGAGGVSRGRHWLVYDHDTLRAVGGWSGTGFIDWQGVNFDGRHGAHPHVVGTVQFANGVGPGWANPETGTFDDPRLRGRDNKPYGPLPRTWAKYRGTYHFGHQTILSYSVGKAKVLEMPGYEALSQGNIAFARTLNVGPTPTDLLMRVAPVGTPVVHLGDGTLMEKDGAVCLSLPKSATPAFTKVLMGPAGEVTALAALAKTSAAPQKLEPFTQGGPRRWPDVLTTTPVIGAGTGAFAVDALTHPVNNPWHCQMRLTGFDFFADGKRAAVSTWDGDVWLVGGIDQPAKGLTWQRIASGLFQPLGVKIVNDRIHVCCRDQIVILNDLNGDGETDFYECFNSDHQVTEHFHEFAMGLQTDAAGNFYYAKAARHALKAVVPQHGTLLRVSKDGTKTDILATGFRAPNGVCLNPDGTYFLTDQEGFWLPKNRINWVKEGDFHGNMWGYHDVTDSSDSAMQPPLCWITNAFDRSPSELLWVTGDGWGPLKGSLLNFSYGYGKTYIIPHEKIGDLMQGGMVALPIPQLPTGIMRGRFHSPSGQLFVCGMFAWAGNQTQPGGFYRIRYTGKPMHVPTSLKATLTGVTLTFTDKLDPKTAADPKNYAVKVWGLKRSEQYGSPHVDEHPLKVTSATVAADGKTVTLEIAGLKPTWCMEIAYTLRGVGGEAAAGVVNNTIHRLAP